MILRPIPSSASSKLIHGGLLYLEQYHFRLVREIDSRARRYLLRTAPNLVRPLMFVLPDPPGGRPWWMIRMGLFIYDLLAGRGSLPRSRSVGKGRDDLAGPLKPGFRLATYWDAWVDDARLVIAFAMDAAERAARIATRTALVSARREGDAWTAHLSDGRTIRAAMMVNAAGPWVADLLHRQLGIAENGIRARLVKGSHILVPPLWEGDHAYILQQLDGRVVFALPYGGYSLIGTTDINVDRPGDDSISATESIISRRGQRLFRRRSMPQPWSGPIRDKRSMTTVPLWPDVNAITAGTDGGPIRLFFRLRRRSRRQGRWRSNAWLLGIKGAPFTATSPVPGGDMDPHFSEKLARWRMWMPAPMLDRITAAYGSRLDRWLAGIDSMEGLGRNFGAGLHEAEIRYLVIYEFARSPKIALRRTKLGRHLQPARWRRLRASFDRSIRVRENDRAAIFGWMELEN